MLLNMTKIEISNRCSTIRSIGNNVIDLTLTLFLPGHFLTVRELHDRDHVRVHGLVPVAVVLAAVVVDDVPVAVVAAAAVDVVAPGLGVDILAAVVVVAGAAVVVVDVVAVAVDVAVLVAVDTAAAVDIGDYPAVAVGIVGFVAGNNFVD